MIGHDVATFGGIPWRRTHGALFPWLPPHAQPALTDKEALGIVAASNAYFVRWEEKYGETDTTEWWHVIKDVPSRVDELPKKVRYLVRQGARYFEIARCSRDEIAGEGYAVYSHAYERYETFEPCYGPTRFAAAVRDMPGQVEFWCARSKSDSAMVAFAENIVESGACFYSTMWFHPASLKQGVAYALIQAMNEHYLGERGMRYVSDGARNLSHQTRIHEFLQSKFGFRREYCELRVVYSWPVGALIKLTYPLRHALGRVPGMARLRVLMEQEGIRRACSRT